jgi:hypothetical protein
MIVPLTRATHIALSLSVVGRTLCGMPVPYMMKHRPTSNIVDVNTFFKTQKTPLVLLGTDEIPPRYFVDIGRKHDWNFVFPNLQLTTRGNPGPSTHQHRHTHLSSSEYWKLCCKEESVVKSLQLTLRTATADEKFVAIVPNDFISSDSVPHRIKTKITTVSFGNDGFVGEWTVIDNNVCTSA